MQAFALQQFEMAKGTFIVLSFLAGFQQTLCQTPLIVNNSTVGVCICVTTGSCGTTSAGTSDGSGVIDARIVNVSLIVSMTNVKVKRV